MDKRCEIQKVYTSCSSGSDNISEAHFIRKCIHLACVYYEDRLDEFLISDESSEKLWCTTCNHKYQLELRTKRAWYLLYVRTASNGIFEITTNGESDDFRQVFPHDWVSFFIQKLY